MKSPTHDSELRGPRVWRGGELAPDAGLVRLDSACQTELRLLADALAANPLPVLSLSPEDFELPACAAAMARAARQLRHGPGFALIDRLPLRAISREAAIAAYWLLLRMIGRPVAQKWIGTMIYDVTDSTGRPPGDGIRADVTNAEQNFHTDNSYNLCPPDEVALLCLHPARDGGISRIASLHAAHNALRADHPGALCRLYRPFLFDRQREHSPDDVKTIARPVFSARDGDVLARLSGQLIRQGHDLAGEALDDEGAAALAALYAVLDDPAAYREFHFQPGQIQIIDNRRLSHKRTGFSDWPEPDRRRHLARLWLRRRGRAFYNG